MKKSLYIIAHSDDLSSPVVLTFHSNETAVKHVGELVSDEYGIKPDPTKDLTEYIQEYYEWVREENDNCCNVTIDFEIVELQNDTSISIVWCVEDVIGQAKNDNIECSEDEAKVILKEMEDRHDYNHGITWETVSYHLDNLKFARKRAATEEGIKDFYKNK